jgi:hypothetical protein
MEEKKLTQEELDQLKSLNDREALIVQNLGIIESKIILMENQKESLKNEYVNLALESQKLASQLQDKYGDININVNNGTFTPAK